MAFYLGLSLLSNTKRELQSREARRILGLLSGRELDPESIGQETGGRPYFTDRPGDFNISHSNRAVAVSLVSQRRIGCDIQYINPRQDHLGVAKKFFFPRELEYIAAAADTAERARRFCSLWVLKESFLKLRGLSVFNMLKTPEFVIDDPNPPGQAPLEFRLWQFGKTEGEQYMLALAREKAPGDEVVQVRWFSEETLPCISMAEIKAVVSPENTVSPKI
ncbi:4'-phosphopantetheinyl transferase superfamily protein [Treponema primitia]|uniref:4'-phosphopantetheinyl transferase family protein n=1 Tax=Treponema primitia TaxID=88058 RepID=UPI003980A693